jgi:LPXTG-motif cell wall-anchored protein
MTGMPGWSSAYAASRAPAVAVSLHQLLLALFDRFAEIVEFVTELLTQSRERLRLFFLDVMLDGLLQLFDQAGGIVGSRADLGDEFLRRGVLFFGVLFELGIDLGEPGIDDRLFDRRVSLQFLADLLGRGGVLCRLVLAEQSFHRAVVLLQQFGDIHRVLLLVWGARLYPRRNATNRVGTMRRAVTKEQRLETSTRWYWIAEVLQRCRPSKGTGTSAMKKILAAPALAGALLLGTGTIADAQQAPAQEDTADDDDDDNGNLGLIGLVGLLGLAGLAGLKRRDRTDNRYDTRYTTPTSQP